MKSVKIICLVLAFVLILPLLHAREEINLDSFLNNFTQINKQLSEKEVMIPSGSEKIISNGNITVNITRLDNSSTGFYFEIKDKRVVSVSKGFPDKKAYQIFTSEEIVNNLIKQENPDILGSYKEGKIKVKAYGFGNNVKFFFAKIFLKFA